MAWISHQLRTDRTTQYCWSLQARFGLSRGWGLIGSSTARSFLTRPPTGRHFSPALPSDCFAIDSRDVPLARRGPSNPLYLSLREWPRLPFTARIERALIDLIDSSKLALLFLS